MYDPYLFTLDKTECMRIQVKYILYAVFSEGAKDALFNHTSTG
jgi:hypothetical protein